MRAGSLSQVPAAAPRPGRPDHAGCTGRGRRPLVRANISAAVLLAADRARASSSSLDDRDQVVRLTLPSNAPVVGSSTGTAAQVNAHRLRA